MLGGAAPAAGGPTPTRVWKGLGLVLHRHGILSILSLRQPGSPRSLKAMPTCKDILFASLHSLKMIRNNHKKRTKGLQINLPSLSPLTAKIELQTQDLQKTSIPQFLINLHYRFHHGSFFFFFLSSFLRQGMRGSYVLSSLNSN